MGILSERDLTDVLPVLVLPPLVVIAALGGAGDVSIGSALICVFSL